MILSQEFHNILDELPATLGTGDQRRETGRSLVPAADGQQCAQVLIVRLEAGELGVAALLDVLVLVEWLHFVVLGETAECVNQMRAQIRIDVLRTELCRSRSIDTPICVITHDACLVRLACRRIKKWKKIRSTSFRDHNEETRSVTHSIHCGQRKCTETAESTTMLPFVSKNWRNEKLRNWIISAENDESGLTVVSK